MNIAARRCALVVILIGLSAGAKAPAAFADDTTASNATASNAPATPMIAKLIVWGETRAQAILRMRRALEEYRVVGVRTNIPFHQTLMDSHRFMGGQYDTRFVEERFSMQDAFETQENYDDIAAILATLVAHRETERSATIVNRNERDTSNWKWVGRWERMHR